MRFTIATLGLAALAVANPAPQGVTSAIAPTASPPSSCSENYSGSFQIQVVNVTKSKRELVERQDTVLTIKLANGVLTDAKGRTGYIAANYQFQFDGPPQTGAIYTAGWSVCSNTSLALGGSTIFYQCLSGTFYNLYDQSTGAQCSPVYIEAIAVSPSGAASQISDGQITASAVASQLTDGQVTASAVKSPLSQSSDGQIEVTTGKPATSAAPVTQISDGQIQATTATAKPVTQITDGQPQVPTATATAKPVTQITDGQPQVPTVKPVTQISDGQPQVPTGRSNSTITATAPSTAVSPYTGAAMTAGVRGEIFGLAAGVLAVALL